MLQNKHFQSTLECYIVFPRMSSLINGPLVNLSLQVVVCQNNSTSKAACCSVMGHELLHMFDFCRAKVDFTNLEHLACTEVGKPIVDNLKFGFFTVNIVYM